MGKFRDLKVWKESIALVLEIYQFTKEGEFARDFALRDQIRRAAISVPSNIAEGDELGSNKQSVRHFLISRGSIAEVITQLIIAKDLEYIREDICELIIEKYSKLAAMLNKLIKVRSE